MAPPVNRRDVLDNYQSVVSAFVTFLEVAVHTLLYERDVYPRTSFSAVRKYNHAVRQSRHPKVCKWVADAMAAVRKEVLKVSRPVSSYCSSRVLAKTKNISEACPRGDLR